MSDQDAVELARLREEHAELRSLARQLEGQVLALQAGQRGPARGGAALFRKRPRGTFDEAIVKHSMTLSVDDRLCLELTSRAIYAGHTGKAPLAGVGGFGIVMDGERYCALPATIKAEGWWHLCAMLGITEVWARAIYLHPEVDQPSAVAAAPAKTERLTIFCEGDW